MSRRTPTERQRLEALEAAAGAEAAEHGRDVSRAVGEAIRQESELESFRRSENIVVRVVSQGSEALGALLILLIAGLMFTNAGARYLLGSPIIWAEEAATSLVIWVAVLGMFIALQRGELLTVRILVRKLPRRAEAPWQVVLNVVGALLFGYLAYLGADYVMTFGQDRTTFLQVPKGIFTSAIPIGGGIIALGLLFEAWRYATGEVLPPGDEDDTGQAPEHTGPVG
jgi:TRAP-type C4-dicarboxylate transport system permease small subunit